MLFFSILATVAAGDIASSTIFGLGHVNLLARSYIGESSSHHPVSSDRDLTHYLSSTQISTSVFSTTNHERVNTITELEFFISEGREGQRRDFICA